MKFLFLFLLTILSAFKAFALPTCPEFSTLLTDFHIQQPRIEKDTDNNDWLVYYSGKQNNTFNELLVVLGHEHDFTAKEAIENAAKLLESNNQGSVNLQYKDKTGAFSLTCLYRLASLNVAFGDRIEAHQKASEPSPVPTHQQHASSTAETPDLPPICPALTDFPEEPREHSYFDPATGWGIIFDADITKKFNLLTIHVSDKNRPALTQDQAIAIAKEIKNNVIAATSSTIVEYKVTKGPCPLCHHWRCQYSIDPANVAAGDSLQVYSNRL